MTQDRHSIDGRPKRSRQFAAAFGILLAIAALLSLQWNDARRRALEQETDARRHEVSRLQNALAGFEKFHQNQAVMQHSLDEFAARLPREAEVDALIADLQQTAQAASLQCVSAGVVHDFALAGCEEKRVGLTLTGDFNGFFAFLSQIETMPSSLRVIRLELTQSAAGAGQVQARLLLGILYQPGPRRTRVASAQ